MADSSGQDLFDRALGTIVDSGAKVLGQVAANFGNEVAFGESKADRLRELAFERQYYNDLNGSGAANGAIAVRSGARTLNDFLFGTPAGPGRPAQQGYFWMVFIGGVAIMFGLIFLLRR